MASAWMAHNDWWRMMARSEPSARQQQIVDAVAEHGSVSSAATALGISRITVETTLARYHTAVCGQRIEELEAENAILRERDAARLTSARLEAVVGRLERLAVPVSHRRIADGGTRVKHQRRRQSEGRASDGG
jgi:hypothetical protein